MPDDGNSLLSYSGAFGMPTDNTLAAPFALPSSYPMKNVSAAGPGSATRPELSGAPPAADTPGWAVAKRTHDFWASKGYSEAVIAGIMAGGPGSESDFTPTVFGDKGTSYGLYQHHGPRLSNPQGTGLLDRYGPNPTEDQQHAYAAWEISPEGPLSRVGEQLKNAKTAADAATIWTRDFGVPGDKSEIGRRARNADRYVGLYSGQAPPATSTAAAPAAAPTSAYAAAPAVAPNLLTSPFSPEAFAKLGPLQKMAYVQALQQMFAPRQAQAAAGGGGGPGAGGVDASIPMSGMRG